MKSFFLSKNLLYFALTAKNITCNTAKVNQLIVLLYSQKQKL